MKCTRFFVADLASGNASEDQYQEWIAHLDTCPACQAKADAHFDSDEFQRVITHQLSHACERDLQMPSYHSSVEIQITATEADNPVNLMSETTDLDFLQPPSHPEMLGRLGRYEVERIIGMGGMGVVFRAYDSELHRVVALKVLAKHLSSSAAARRRFAREAQAAAAILHPNVLPIYNVEADAATPFLVMQYVSGKSLQARVEHTGPLEVADVLRIGKQTAEALAAAHDQGLIHRDVKPANILLEDETDRTVLGDFGLARTSDDASLTRSGIVTGTPHYMSPEQAKGEPITASSDLFSLGSVLYFMLAGYPPFRAESAMSVLNCVCHRPHRPLHDVNSNVPRELSQLVDRLLAKRSGARPASAAVIAMQLEQLLARLQQGQLRIGLPWWSDFRVQLVSVVLVAGLLVGGWMKWGPELQPRPASHEVASPGQPASSGTSPRALGETKGTLGTQEALPPTTPTPEEYDPIAATPGQNWARWDSQMDSLWFELQAMTETPSVVPVLVLSTERQAEELWSASTLDLQRALDHLEQSSLPADLHERVLNKE